MGRTKMSILIENDINNRQIYVPVLYLIEINILVAFWGQKSWKNVYSAASPPRMHANARCGLRGKKIKISKILEIDIFKFIFGISFKK